MKVTLDTKKDVAPLRVYVATIRRKYPKLANKIWRKLEDKK